MKYIYRKKIVMVTALLLLSVLCSCREKQENKISEKKINYEKEENSIEVWKEKSLRLKRRKFPCSVR